jgi:DNA-binding PadR family transcriptional regulator
VSAKHAILGLVIKQPSYAWRIAMEVRRQLRFADLADSYPYWALEKLKAEGLVHQVNETGAPAGKRRAGRQILYEATVNGVQAFEDWLRSTPDECSLRDDLQFRLAIARPHDVPTIIELITESECVCITHEQGLEQFQPREEGFASSGTLCDVARNSELIFWRGRLKRLQEIREMLEAILAELAVGAPLHAQKS